MQRQYYLDLAARGVRVPIAAHMTLHEQSDPEAVLRDGKRLAAVLKETARRFQHPLAFSVMDLALEKELMLEAMGIPLDRIPGYQFDQLPTERQRRRIHHGMDVLTNERMHANCEALSLIASEDGWLPIGVSIGPFSLSTKLVKDPIPPVFLVGAGEAADPGGEIAVMEAMLALAEVVVRASCLAQIQAGAKAIMVCEPAANAVFFSPNQVKQKGSRVFSHFVIEPNRRLKGLFDSKGCDLILHDCGELIPEMISAFSVLDPAILSLGSPVVLWDMARHVPKTTVLLGNLPTKQFYAEVEMPVKKSGDAGV